eukprot:CAMPEP_0114671132 /NCGR_PEP_ID=MMETSP0191-20121206/40641_1 /TAXON_ID=126664 /ORGANISM="Sorites sp." /LENGTH=331 /DNA_ID=CAMNT_0001930247 /DNA_START=938 /DNA_END=1933 /DNA_ORIENTATION=-
MKKAKIQKRKNQLVTSVRMKHRQSVLDLERKKSETPTVDHMRYMDDRNLLMTPTSASAMPHNNIIFNTPNAKDLVDQTLKNSIKKSDNYITQIKLLNNSHAGLDNITENDETKDDDIRPSKLIRFPSKNKPLPETPPKKNGVLKKHSFDETKLVEPVRWDDDENYDTCVHNDDEDSDITDMDDNNNSNDSNNDSNNNNNDNNSNDDDNDDDEDEDKYDDIFDNPDFNILNYDEEVQRLKDKHIRSESRKVVRMRRLSVHNIHNKNVSHDDMKSFLPPKLTPNLLHSLTSPLPSDGITMNTPPDMFDMDDDNEIFDITSQLSRNSGVKMTTL